MNAREGSGPGAIIIVRHGRPALNRDLHVDWRGYKDWWGLYDDGGLASDQAPPAATLEAARGADIILSSPLQRSVETAEALAEGRAIITDAVFEEAALPPPPLPGVRMRPGHWGVWARIVWWLGYAGGLEGRRAAEERACRAVETAIHAASGGRTVLVCAHGWFNRMMRPVLLARGWRCVRDDDDRYWSFRRYEPPAM